MSNNRKSLISTIRLNPGFKIDVTSTKTVLKFSKKCARKIFRLCLLPTHIIQTFFSTTKKLFNKHFKLVIFNEKYCEQYGHDSIRSYKKTSIWNNAYATSLKSIRKHSEYFSCYNWCSMMPLEIKQFEINFIDIIRVLWTQRNPCNSHELLIAIV